MAQGLGILALESISPTVSQYSQKAYDISSCPLTDEEFVPRGGEHMPMVTLLGSKEDEI